MREKLYIPKILFQMKSSSLLVYALSIALGLLFACESSIAPAAAPEKPAPRSVTDIRAELLRPNSDQVLVAAHRGDWRNAPENSLQAIENAIAMGVDIVEIDVRMTRDSQLVLMHDATIDRTTTGKGQVGMWTLDSLKTLYLRNGVNHPTHHRIPTLEEAMRVARGRIMVNLDKVYDDFNLAYTVLRETGTVDHAIMKGKVARTQVRSEFGTYLDEVIFMPIVNLLADTAAVVIADYQANDPPAAFELLFREKNELLAEFPDIRARGSRVWVNTLWESLNAGYEDDMAVANPDSIYGYLIERGVNMIQTDRPALLLNYLRTKGLHD